MIKIICYLLLLLSGAPIAGAQAESTSSDKAIVMLFGTFHFDDPGLDQVKNQKIDVMTEANQQALQRLTQRLANDFRPTHVLLECDKANTDKLNQSLKAYMSDDFALPKNEIYQIGFRLAKAAGLEEVVCFDEREVHWQGQSLIEHMKQHDPEAYDSFQSLIGDVTTDMAHKHATLSLIDLLRDTNDAEQDRLNRSLYMLTNHVAAFDSYLGADAAASWWHRNFRMYANVQMVAKPETRVFVLAGQGHTAILKKLLQDDAARVQESVADYLR